MPIESDWKKFSAMVPRLRERYLAERNAKFAASLTEPGKNDTERFWDALEEMKATAKALQRCLDGHSRSRMWDFLFSMVADGMLKREDLTVFSDELRGQLGELFDQRKA